MSTYVLSNYEPYYNVVNPRVRNYLLGTVTVKNCDFKIYVSLIKFSSMLNTKPFFKESKIKVFLSIGL